MGEKKLERILEKAFKSERLTKKFLMALSEGEYLVSNVHLFPGKPIFQEKVVTFSKREDQWNRIKSVLADQRLCYVYRNKSDYNVSNKYFMKYLMKKRVDLKELYGHDYKNHYISVSP